MGMKHTNVLISVRALLVLAVAVLTVSVVCLAAMHYHLQEDYDSLSESYSSLTRAFPMLVNDQWTDNIGVDFNYVHYEGIIFNSGYRKAYKVTLLVSIYGIDKTLLEREEFLIGDINLLQYQTFDVNVEYSGELTEVSTGVSWK